MHWTDDELKALYQLAAVQPRNWFRVAEVMRQLYPDRRQYTVGSIQQKYNEAVRTPFWTHDECNALMKYGKQFPGQWDRIAALMKMTFGDQRRPYIGEILLRKWKRLRREAGIHDSDAESTGTDPGTEIGPGAPDQPAANGSTAPPPLSDMSVPIWQPPYNNDRFEGPVRYQTQPEPPMDMSNSAPEVVEGRQESHPVKEPESAPVKIENEVVPVEPNVANVVQQPVTADHIGDNCVSQPTNTDGDFHVVDQYAEEQVADDDCYEFNPEEAAEILADFGCQFVSELELALSRSGSVSVPANGTADDSGRNHLELAVVAGLADRTRLKPSSDVEEGEIPDADADSSVKAVLSRPPSGEIGADTKPVIDENDQQQPTATDASGRGEPLNAPDIVVETKTTSPDKSASAVDPAPHRRVTDDDLDSSDNDLGDDDSKAPISKRIQRRRKATVTPKDTKEPSAAESDHVPLRPRKRSKSLDHEKPTLPARKLSTRRSRDDSEPEAKKPRRRKDSAESESTVSRRRPTKSVRKRKSEPESSESDRAPSPLPRLRRGSDTDSRKTRRQQPKPAPASESRRLAIWAEEEEQALATLRRQFGGDWEKIGSALQEQFPEVRPYTVVSVRCKWSHMVRHDHPLAFESDEEEDDEEESAEASALERLFEKEQPEKEIDESKAIVPKQRAATSTLVSDNDDDMAVCDVDVPDSGQVSDAGYDHAGVDITEHNVLQLFIRGKIELDDDDRSIRDSRRYSSHHQDHVDSGAEDLAICDL